MSDFGRLLNAGIDVDGPGGLIQFNQQVRFNQGAVPTIGIGNIYYLDYDNGADVNTGKTPTQAIKTLTRALALVTADQNDVVYIMDNGTDVTEATQFTWNKGGCYIVGVGSVKSVGYSHLSQMAIEIAPVGALRAGRPPTWSRKSSAQVDGRRICAFQRRF